MGDNEPISPEITEAQARLAAAKSDHSVAIDLCAEAELQLYTARILLNTTQDAVDEANKALFAMTHPHAKTRVTDQQHEPVEEVKASVLEPDIPIVDKPEATAIHHEQDEKLTFNLDWVLLGNRASMPRKDASKARICKIDEENTNLIVDEECFELTEQEVVNVLCRVIGSWRRETKPKTDLEEIECEMATPLLNWLVSKEVFEDRSSLSKFPRITEKMAAADSFSVSEHAIFVRAQADVD